MRTVNKPSRKLCSRCGVQHVAQCEVLPRGEGPSPDERVRSQLEALGLRAPAERAA